MLRTTSPGRCAVPDGMFSTRPSTPTTLARALRAGQRQHRAERRRRHRPCPHFMSSMPAAGLIEMPPVSKQTPLPTQRQRRARRRRPASASPRRRAARALPCATPSSARMPSAVSRRPIQDLDLHARPRRAPAQASAKALGVEHVGGLADQIACRGTTALASDRARSASAAARVVPQNQPEPLGRPLVVLVLGGPVLGEAIGAQLARPGPASSCTSAVAKPRSRPSGAARCASRTFSARSFCASLPPASSRSSRVRPSGLPSASSSRRSSPRPGGQQQIDHPAVLQRAARRPPGAAPQAVAGSIERRPRRSPSLPSLAIGTIRVPRAGSAPASTRISMLHSLSPPADRPCHRRGRCARIRYSLRRHNPACQRGAGGMDGRDFG